MLGISTSCFYGRLTTEDAIFKISELGACCVEVFLNSFSEYRYEYINMVSGRLKNCGLAFNTVHTLPTQFEPQLFAITERQRNDALSFFRTVLKGAHEGGCKTYVMHGKPFFKKNINAPKINIHNIADTLRGLCDIAEEYDMSIALENVHWAMCNNIEFINEIKSKVHKLKFTLDIKQAHFSKIHWQEYIKSFGDRLTNVHVCDYADKQTRLPGKGEADFKLLKVCLEEVNYQGNIILEVYERDYEDYIQLKDSLEFLKDIFRG